MSTVMLLRSQTELPSLSHFGFTRKFLYNLASLKEKTVAFGVQDYQLSEFC